MFCVKDLLFCEILYFLRILTLLTVTKKGKIYVRLCFKTILSGVFLIYSIQSLWMIFCFVSDPFNKTNSMHVKNPHASPEDNFIKVIIKQALRKFSEAARIILILNLKYLNLKKEIMIKKTSIFKFYISEIIKFLSATSKVILCHFESKISWNQCTVQMYTLIIHGLNPNNYN